jgi:hypothetical protein|nr:MAG TPA: Lipopolysaccharide assembly protein A domain [Caudoviricetes sp.]
MLVLIFFAVGAIFCTAAVANYIWQARYSFREVYNQLKEEWQKV